MNNEVGKIKELIKQLNKASDAYYNSSESIITDYEWDGLFDELKELESETGCIFANSPTQNPGYEVKSKLEKVTHSHPMLSLGKTKSVDDLIKFSNGKDCIISLKMDGLTVLNTYENGELIQSETRGNGEIGELVTHNAKVFKNLPVHISIDRKFEIEGEAIILKKDFEVINSKSDKKYKNPRNLVSGSVRQLDNKVAKDRNVRFIVWKIPFGLTHFTEGFDYANQIGFEVVPYVKYNSKTDDINEKIAELKSIAEEKSYPIDGLVITYDNVEYGKSLGNTGHHPRHSLAFKFYNEEEVTTLKDIEWGMGKTGQLTPVAIFDDVEIDGTTVNRASLHNVSIFKELQLGIGDEITVYKANEIIPQIRDNLTRSNTITIPSTCPICDGPTKIVKENDSEVLICDNPTCSGKLLGKLKHAVSRDALNIDGLSEATIQKFIDLGWLTSIKDIYHLSDYEKRITNLEGFGKKSVTKLMKAIENSRNTTFDRFLYALSIPLCGEKASKMIAETEDYQVENFFQDMALYGAKFFNYLPGVGDALVNNLDEYFKDNCNKIFELSKEFKFTIPTKVNLTDNRLEGLTFVVTGKVNQYKSRDELKKEIESLGGKVAGSVSAKTTVLINNDINSTSSKNKKAKELDVPILTENMFIDKYLK